MLYLFEPAVRFGILTGNFNRALVGLRAAVAEENAVHGAGPDQFFGQFGDRGGVIIARRVHQRCRLFLNRLHQTGMAVAEGIDGDAGEKVQVVFPGSIPDAHALTANQCHGQTGVDVEQIVVVQPPYFGLVHGGRDLSGGFVQRIGCFVRCFRHKIVLS